MDRPHKTISGWGLVAWIVLAQAAASGKQYSFHAYGPADGLINQSVTCLMEDRRGFVWAGTQNGLYRYEGLKFTRFDTADGLPDNSIQFLHESAAGQIWVSTRLGVAYWNDGKFVRDAQLGAIPVFGFSSMVSKPDGTIYAGTSQGLAIGHESRGNPDAHFRFFTHQPVYSVALDRSGAVLFSGGDQLWKLQDERLTGLTESLGLPRDQWNSILADREGKLWVRSAGALLVSRQDATDTQTQAQAIAGIPYSADLGTLFESNDGHIFVPTEHGLILFTGNTRELVGTEQGLPVNAASCVIQDHEGSIWVGLRGMGLVRWLGFGSWEGWKTTDGLTSDVIWDVERDSKGTLWVATDDGLNVLDPVTERFRRWPGNGRTRGMNIRCLLDDPAHGALWFGTKPGGLFRLDVKSSRMQHFGTESGLTSDRVNDLDWDRAGYLWVSTSGGLFRGTLSGGGMRFDRTDLPFSDPTEEFNGTTVDAQGRLWAAGSSGLLELETTGWRRYSTTDGLAAPGVSQVAQTPDGAMWVAYLSNSGVSRLTEEKGQTKIMTFTTRNGLASNSSVFLGVDSRRRLWVGSDNGVDVRSGAGWRHYGQSDGLIWDDTDAVAFHADGDGSVWIGTSRGLSRYRGPMAPQSAPAPWTNFVNAKAGASEENPARFFTAQWMDHSISFAFTSSTHLDEDDVRFRYRLAGFDRSWTETAERKAVYSNLPAGDYTFEVLSRSAAGVWSPQPARSTFRILAPWWRTGIFRSAAGIGFLGLALAAWRFRIRMLIRRQNQLEELLRQAEQADRQKTDALSSVMRAEASQRGRSKVLELVGSRAPLSDTLQALLDVVEIEKPEMMCAVFRVSGDGLRLAASRMLPEELRGWLERNPAPLANGTVGASQQQATGPGAQEFGALLRRLELTAAKTTAIFSSSGEVLGTIAVFLPATGELDQPINLTVIEEAVRLAGIAMENLDLYRQLSYRAQFDALTDLPNRALFQDRLEQAVRHAGRSGEKFAVAWLDLDGFKHVNDTLGHHAGDTLLRKTAKRLLTCLRGSDSLARVGGDEFTIILTQVETHEDIAAAMKKVLSAFETPISVDGQSVLVSASVGVCVYPDDSEDSAELVKRADIAMYQAKRIGKNALVFYSSELSQLESGRVAFESHLRQALGRKEFEILYQPQFNQNGAVECVEALLRWKSPELGPISPGQFIPVAEATGLIIPLGHWVLMEACRQNVVWGAAGAQYHRVAVNVSAAQFAREDFAETIAAILRETGMPAQNLELELTETAVMSDSANSARQLLQIRELGVRVCIDDFGTGYSSLSYLQRLPINTLKLDKSFVQNLSGERTSRVMVQAIVNLAHELNLEVVAEGVETEEQLHCVWAAGCDLAQGFLLSRPISLEDATPLIRMHHALRRPTEKELLTIA